MCQHYGIDTSDYSFAYIAGWSHGKETPELKASLNTIRQAASELITEIDVHLAELTIGREGQEQSETAAEKAGAETHSVLADLKAKQAERSAATTGHAKHKEEIR